MIRFFSTIEGRLVGMEACATAHYWARELTALGHTVKLVPQAYVAYLRERHEVSERWACNVIGRIGQPSDTAITVLTTLGFVPECALAGEAAAAEP